MDTVSVLVMSSNVEGGMRMTHLDEEYRAISGALVDPRFIERSSPALQFADLDRVINKANPAILHLSAHGQATGRVILRTQGGSGADHDPEGLAQIIARAGPELRLVVLNVCHGRALAEALIRSGVACVIYPEARIPDASAPVLAEVFYGALASGESVKVAFDRMQSNVSIDDPRGGGGLSILCAPGVDAGVVRFQPRPRPRHQQVIVLDVYDTPFDLDGALEQVDAPVSFNERKVYKITDYGAPKMERDTDAAAYDWGELARATEALVRAVRAEEGPAALQHYVVTGAAPMAAFAHVGRSLSGWSGRLTIVNWRRNGQRWDVLELSEDTAAAEGQFFGRVVGLNARSATTEVVALFVSVMGLEADEDAISASVVAHDLRLGGLVRLETTDATMLLRDNASVCARAMGEAAAAIERFYPRAAEVVLFVAGPAPLALIAARAFNVNQRRLVFTEFQQRVYLPTWSHPYMDPGAPSIPVDSDAQLRRQATLRALLSGVLPFKEKLKPEQMRLPAGLRGEPSVLYEVLQGLEISDVERGDSFQMDVLEGRLSFGAGLLEALATVEASHLPRLGVLFTLHEVYHYAQGLDSTNYRDIGRAGFVLEEIDYWADAVALLTATRWAVDRGGEDGVEACGELLLANIDAALAGIEAFDRMEQGEAMRVLPERRLRRYLIWYLQRARAEVVREPAEIDQLLEERLFVELAPLPGHLSPRHDKIVRLPEDNASVQVFVALGGRLIRSARLPSNFEPMALIDAVRRFDAPLILEGMRYLRNSNEALLAPWIRARAR